MAHPAHRRMTRLGGIPDAAAPSQQIRRLLRTRPQHPVGTPVADTHQAAAARWTEQTISALDMSPGGMPMLNAEDNDLLCRVDGDAPMGRMMRRHWLPACLSEEVAKRDGPPGRVRLLGGAQEELAVSPASRAAE